MSVLGHYVYKRVSQSASAGITATAQRLDDYKGTAITAAEHALDQLTTLLKLVMFALATTTALATGCITALGFETIPFLDKWTVLGTIVFYAFVCISLLSPIIALPNFAAELSRQIQRRTSARGTSLRLKQAKREKEAAEAAAAELKTRVDEAAAQREKYSETLAEAERNRRSIEQEQLPERTWYEWLAGSDPEAERKARLADAEAKEKTIRASEYEVLSADLEDAQSRVETAINDLKTAQSAKNYAEQKEAWSPFILALRIIGYLSLLAYALALLIVLMNVMDEFAGLYIWLATVALISCAWRVSFLAVAPLLTALFFIAGHLMGQHIMKAEPTTIVSVDGKRYDVSVIFANDANYIALGRYHSLTGDDRKQLGVIPRSQVGIAVIAAQKKQDRAWDWIAGLKPFSWLTSPAPATASTAQPAVAPRIAPAAPNSKKH